MGKKRRQQLEIRRPLSGLGCCRMERTYREGPGNKNATNKITLIYIKATYWRR